jgi:hypothetical protein
VARHIFQACPVWIYTQSNITNIIFRFILQPITVNAQTEGEREQEILGAVSSLESGDSPHDAGGIDLKKSSQKLVKQDKLDKREFRDRIKQKHREKRMKNKVKRKRCEVCHKIMLFVIYSILISMFRSATLE